MKTASMRALGACFLYLVHFVWVAPSASAQVLIPAPNRVEHVYDPTRNILFITTSTSVLRWDVASQSLLTPFNNIGSNLSDIDVTPDGQFAYVGERTAGATSGFVRKVDLNTGTRTNITYNLSSLERGVDHLAITSNGKAFFTTDFAGSGWTPLHEITLADDSLDSRRSVRQSTGLVRGPDRSLLFLQESNISSGPIFTYSALSDSFPAGRNTNSFVGGVPAAVNRNGSLVAFGNSLLDDSLSTVDLLPGGAGGYQFDPLQDVLYIADVSTEEVIAVNTTTLAELGRIPIGEPISGANNMSISGDARYLFVSTASGIRQLANPFAVPEATSFCLLALGAVALYATSRRSLGE